MTRIVVAKFSHSGDPHRAVLLLSTHGPRLLLERSTSRDALDQCRWDPLDIYETNAPVVLAKLVSAATTLALADLDDQRRAPRPEE